MSKKAKTPVLEEMKETYPSLTMSVKTLSRYITDGGKYCLLAGGGKTSYFFLVQHLLIFV